MNILFLLFGLQLFFHIDKETEWKSEKIIGTLNRNKISGKQLKLKEWESSFFSRLISYADLTSGNFRM